VSRLALYDAWVYESQLPSMFQMARAKGVGEALFALFYSERSDERITLGFYDSEVVTQQLVDEVDKAFERPGTKAAALATVRGMDFKEVEKTYGTVKVPTLLLWGREDVVTPPSIGERLVRQLPKARMTVYPRCGHFPMIEAAAESTRDLIDFLEEP
jgi:pimeloyl-ACP methyl ester carboxylesterase